MSTKSIVHFWFDVKVHFKFSSAFVVFESPNHIIGNLNILDLLPEIMKSTCVLVAVIISNRFCTYDLVYLEFRLPIYTT